MTADTPETPIRDAATLVLWRAGRQGPEVLMGQRGARAAFMASKFVFPGGAIDPSDALAPLARPLPARCADRLAMAGSTAPEALAAAAIRELAEEAGLMLARPGPWTAEVPAGWQRFAADGLLPDAGALTFFFRAITPPGRTRRFDARFFMADAAELAGEHDDFSNADSELSHLKWLSLPEARALDLPFVTEVVLAEVSAYLSGADTLSAGVPFFDNSTTRPIFRRLG